MLSSFFLPLPSPRFLTIFFCVTPKTMGKEGPQHSFTHSSVTFETLHCPYLYCCREYTSWSTVNSELTSTLVGIPQPLPTGHLLREINGRAQQLGMAPQALALASFRLLSVVLHTMTSVLRSSLYSLQQRSVNYETWHITITISQDFAGNVHCSETDGTLQFGRSQQN